MKDTQQDRKSNTADSIDRLLASYDEHPGTNFIDVKRLPDKKGIHQALDLLMELLFPGYSGERTITGENMLYVIGDLLTQARRLLREQLVHAYRHDCPLENCEEPTCEKLADSAVDTLLDSLPDIRSTLKKDVRAAFDGDPAARSEEEVVICYPGLQALAVHRLSHILFLQQVPLIPRMMNEIAHSETGIDIHPGASIGEGLFIDHGTGVVIGETTVIGRDVKIYQGVTLGALSFPKDACGNLIKGSKRHPTIEDRVTIYAHATILGDITIGSDSLVGSNVWLKNDVPPKTLVSMEAPNISFRNREKH